MYKVVTRGHYLLYERLASGTSIMIVTHDDAQAERMASRRFHMEAGTMTETGAKAKAKGKAKAKTKVKAKTKTKTKGKTGGAA